MSIFFLSHDLPFSSTSVSLYIDFLNSNALEVYGVIHLFIIIFIYLTDHWYSFDLSDPNKLDSVSLQSGKRTLYYNIKNIINIRNINHKCVFLAV